MQLVLGLGLGVSAVTILNMLILILYFKIYTQIATADSKKTTQHPRSLLVSPKDRTPLRGRLEWSMTSA